MASSSTDTAAAASNVGREQFPVAKRQKRMANFALLPTECWAHALDFLVYKDVRSCTEAAPLFIHQVLPLIQVLTLTNYREMNVTHVKRFTTDNIKRIHVFSYVLVDHIEHNSGFSVLCEETATRMVPFLSHFKNLNHVFIGGERSGTKVTYCPPGYQINHQEVIDSALLHRGLIRSFCGAFRMETLSKNMTLEGIIVKCIWRVGTPCQVCSSIYKTFPFRQIFPRFARSAGMYHIEGERVLNIIQCREGGLKFLQDPSRFIQVLCERQSFFTHRDGPYALAPGGKIAFVPETTFDFIRLLIELGCNPANVDRNELLNIIFVPKSSPPFLPPGESRVLARPEERYIMENFFRFLVKHKFPISESDCVVIPNMI